MKKNNNSKRIKLKTLYTNAKKRKSRKVKTKRDMKKNPNKYHKKKSDPGIPNSCPFKIDLLREREKILKDKEEDKKKSRESKLKEIKQGGNVGKKRKLTDVLNLKDGDEDAMDVDGGARPSKAAKLLAQKANEEHKEFRNKMKNFKNNPDEDAPDYRWRNWSDKVYYKQVKQVVQSSNIILEVLDARDPMGTRCQVLEEMIRSQPMKKLVLVLNKADLVPKTNLQGWLRYLRSEAPTVAFKAAVHKPNKFKSYRDRWSHMGEELMRSSSSMGAEVLLQLLKNYSRSHPDTGIVVGVVGLPNVGKSSLINSMKKMKACEVANVPGCTKNIKEIKLDKKLHILDCPGVVLPGKDMDPIDAVLKNLVKLDTVNNLLDCALEIFRRSDSLKLAMFYNTRKTEDGEEFLGYLAKSCNKMNKSGVYDKDIAAKKLIYDWNHGILKYFTEVPKFQESEVKSGLKTSLAPAFDLDTLTCDKEDNFMNNLDTLLKTVETMQIQPGKPVVHVDDDFLNEEAKKSGEEEEEDDDAEDDNDDEVEEEADDDDESGDEDMEDQDSDEEAELSDE